jgi:hypothetical protein
MVRNPERADGVSLHIEQKGGNLREERDAWGRGGDRDEVSHRGAAGRIKI